MSAEQIFLEQLSPGAGPVYRSAEYGLEWGAYGSSAAKQAFSEAGYSSGDRHISGDRYSSSALDFRSAPSPGTRPGAASGTSCLEVGVMFDVCLPKDQINPQHFDSQKAGGDFADVVPLHGDWVALFLGNACGQGAAAALAVPQALYSLRQLLSGTPGTFGNYSSGKQSSDFYRDPAHTLKRLNRHLCGPALPAACASVSLSLAVLNTKTGETVCACAGSEPPLILRARGPIETVNAGRVALGVENGRTYHSVEFLLGQGDALLLATDGVTKARKANESGGHTSLRYEGLTGLALEAYRLGGPPGRMARAVLRGAREFAGGVFHDHASVLVAARR